MIFMFNPEANFGENKLLENPIGSLVWVLHPYLQFLPCSEAATEMSQRHLCLSHTADMPAPGLSPCR